MQCACLLPGFVQVGDITAFGEPEQAANYLLPRKAVLYKFSKEVVPLKPRITKLGEVPVPPRTYYRCAANGLHSPFSPV